MLVRKIKADNDMTPRTKRYTARMTEGFEKLHAEMVTLQKEREAQRELLQTRKKHGKGKRVLLQNKFVFSTPEVLKITVEAESGKVKKKGASTTRPVPNTARPNKEEHCYSEGSHSESESSVIVVAHSRRS